MAQDPRWAYDYTMQGENLQRQSQDRGQQQQQSPPLQQQQHIQQYYQPQMTYQQQYPPPPPQAMPPPPQMQPELMNQQQQQIPYNPYPSSAFMYAADPMMAAAMSSGQNLVTSSNSWIDRNLKPLFAVDDSYVLTKLSFILFPFRRWHSSIAKPDLYIPLMSFITYVLGAGYLLGIKNQFTPEKLGMISSSALFCLGLEVILMAILFSIFNAGISFLYCVAFASYKFVPIIWALVISLFFKSNGYYMTIGYTTLSLGYFLVRSCHMVLAEQAVGEENRKGIYLSGIFCLLQPLIMFWLSYHLVPY